MAREPGLWRTIWSLSLIVLVVGYYITGSPLWGYKTRWTNWRYVRHIALDPSPATTYFSEVELAKFTGADPNKPILLAVNGKVYDVSARPETYGPLGAYRFFSGRDAARAFATGCFSTDLTHDLRGLTSEELEAVKSWQLFFENHHLYWQVGQIEHGPLVGDPPEPCRGRRKPAS